MRRSVHTFLQHYQYFTCIAALIALPFSISVLISQTLVMPRSFSLLHSIYARLHSLFDAAGFPSSSEFFALVCLKLSQTISSSILTFPFTISFLLLAKASVIHFLKTHFQKYNSNDYNKCSSFLELYSPLLSTHLWNSFVIFSANATSICILFFAFTFLEGIHFASPKWAIFLSAVGAVFYSIVLANALVITNLALVSSGMEGSKSGGFFGILKACVLIRGRTSTALVLAVPINIGLAAVEALFHFRLVATSYDHDQRQVWVLALEGLLIGYLYSIIVVLDVIISCFFYQSCMNKSGPLDTTQINLDQEIDEEGYCYYDNGEKLKGLEEFV